MPTNTSVQLQYRIQRAIFQLNAMAERMRSSGFFDQLSVKLKKFDSTSLLANNEVSDDLQKPNENIPHCALQRISASAENSLKCMQRLIYPNLFQISNMIKRKIIVKNSKARQRLRQQKGLQPDFTTYVMGQSCEQPQVLPEFSQSPQTFFWDDWYIVLEEDVWEPDYNRNLFWVYQEQDQRIEKLEFQEQNSRLARLNEEIFPKMALFEPEQASISKKAKFQAVLRAKDFPKDSTPQQIHPLCEQLQRVRSQN